MVARAFVDFCAEGRGSLWKYYGTSVALMFAIGTASRDRNLLAEMLNDSGRVAA